MVAKDLIKTQEEEEVKEIQILLNSNQTTVPLRSLVVIPCR